MVQLNIIFEWIGCLSFLVLLFKGSISSFKKRSKGCYPGPFNGPNNFQSRSTEVSISLKEIGKWYICINVCFSSWPGNSRSFSYFPFLLMTLMIVRTWKVLFFSFVKKVIMTVVQFLLQNEYECQKNVPDRCNEAFKTIFPNCKLW